MAAALIPAKYGLVVGCVGASVLVHHIYMSFKVTSARKKFGVKYPHMYASKEVCPKASEADINAFNCTQRGHQNSLENQPAFLAMLMGVGLRYPVTASVLALFFLAGRVGYMEGYASGNPNKRYNGFIGYIGTLGLLGAAIRIGIDALRGLPF